MTIAGLVLCALLWVSPGAAASWRKAETQHFTIYSSGGQRELEDFAREAEKFDGVLRMRFHIPAEDDTRKLPIYILPKAKNVALLKGDKTSSLAGFYEPALEGSFAISNCEDIEIGGQSSSRQTLFHEYTHHFFMRYLPEGYPLWLNEGLAEYYSTVEFPKGGTFRVGQLALGRGYNLVNGPRFPIQRLLFGELEGLNREEADLFYGRAWLLTHKLMSSQDGIEALTGFLADLGKGTSPEAAAVAHFGALDALDRELEQMTRKGLPMFTYPLPANIPDQVTVTELDETASRLVELQIERRGAADKIPARDALRQLALQNPQSADAWNELAHAEFDVAELADRSDGEKAGYLAAEEAADKALALKPDHVRANVMKGRALLARLGADAEAEDFEQARRYFVGANRADPMDPLALQQYFRSYVDLGDQPPELALAGLENAFYFAPEITQYRIDYAMSLANGGDFDRAIRLIDFLANDPHMSRVGESLLNQLRRMQADGNTSAHAH